MKRLGVLIVVVAAVLVLWRPATGQDNYEERIASLETRVAVLEGATSRATPSAATVTIYGVVAYGDYGTDSITPNGQTLLGDGLQCYVVPPPGVTIVRDTDPVTVKDETGTVIATSVVFPGITPADKPYLCAFTFTVYDILPAAFYTIEVGDLPAVTISAADLAQSGGHVELNAGDPVGIDDDGFLTPPAR